MCWSTSIITAFASTTEGAGPTGIPCDSFLVRRVRLRLQPRRRIGPAHKSTGNTPHSAVVNPSSKFVYVGNCNDAIVTGYTIDTTTGALTPMAVAFPGSAHPLSIAVNLAGTLVYAADADSGISGWSIDQTTGALTSIGPVSGTRSSTIEINPAGTVAYATGDSERVCTAYTIEPGGALTLISGLPFPSAPGADGMAISTSGEIPLCLVLRRGRLQVQN